MIDWGSARQSYGWCRGELASIEQSVSMPFRCLVAGGKFPTLTHFPFQRGGVCLTVLQVTPRGGVV